MHLSFGIILKIAIGFALQANANEFSDARRFREIFLNQVRTQYPNAPAAEIEGTFFLPDAAVDASLQAPSLEKALEFLRTSNLEKLRAASRPLVAALIPATQAKPRLTLVILPGLFSEFIANRAFEEVFERPSALREQFVAQVAARKMTDSITRINNYREGEAPLADERSLDQLINTGEIKIGEVTVRVILMFTEFSTLESLGDSAQRATVFNRRLQKYLDVTGPQQMVFVGYSRGTILGLEMLAQAQAAGSPWVNDVKGMVSLSGVVWGSALADDTYYNTNAPMNHILMQLKLTTDSLEISRADTGFLEGLRMIARNLNRWLEFGKVATAEFIAMNQGKTAPKSVSPVKSMLAVDPRSPIGIVRQMWGELGLKKFNSEYDLNIVRFKYFVKTLMTSVEELTTRSRVNWWKTHVLPKNVIYYAVTAAMANPDNGAFETTLFNTPLNYGQGSYDDISLLQNRIDYQSISGLALNDSQVSVTEASFAPQIIASLNPANAGLKTKFLGIAGTHHWGMALRDVNKMFGSTNHSNGFPREAMLRALAIQILNDN